MYSVCLPPAFSHRPACQAFKAPHHIKPVCAAALLAVGLLCASPSEAQQAPVSPAPAPSPSAPRATTPTAALTPVTVTDFAPANYTVPVSGFGALGEKGVADTPISITNFSRDLLERQQATKLSDVLRNDPSVTNVPTAGAFQANFFNIRGYEGSGAGFTFDGMGPGVGFVPLQGTLEATERFELIKGPVSSLYGFTAFASVGGHINLVPKKPLNESLTTLTAGFSEKSTARLAGDISRRFGTNDQFGIRINAVAEGGKPNIDRTRGERKLLTLAGEWKVTNNLLLEAGYNYYKLRNDGVQNPFNLKPGLPVPAVPDARTNFYQPWNYLQTEINVATVGASWKFAPDWKASVKALVGNRPSEGIVTSATIFNAQGDYESPLAYIPAPTKFKFNSYQLGLNGKLRTGSIQHDVTLAFNQEKWLVNQGRAPLGLYESNIYKPVYFDQPTLPTNIPVSRASDSIARGLFISDSITFNEQWSSLIALRQSSVNYRNFESDGAVTLDQSAKKLSPVLGLMYKPTPALGIYANYAEGLQLGGQAPSTAVNADQFLAPVKTSQREVGIKVDLPIGLSLTAAYFDISKPLEYLNSANVFVQAGNQNHKGLELTAGGSITRRLAVVGGLMLINPRQKNTGNPDTEGKVALGVPRINLPLYATYDVADLPGLTVSAGLQHFGKQFVDDANTLELKGWTRYDVGLRYASKLIGKQTTFNINIENISNRKYFASAAGGSLALGAPRTVRASLTTAF